MKEMKKLSRTQTAVEVRRILNMLPSRELVVNSHVNFSLPGVPIGDCRFCAKGAVETFSGERRLVKNPLGFYSGSIFTDKVARVQFDWDVLNEIEDAMFGVDTKSNLGDSAEGRRKLFQVALAKCDEIAAE